MIQSKQTMPSGDRLVGFFEWVNGKLTPALGPAMLGPYDDDGVARSGPCPVCGGAMSTHAIDRSSPDVVLVCPARALILASTIPEPRLSMLDMPTRHVAKVRPGHP